MLFSKEHACFVKPKIFISRSIFIIIYRFVSYNNDSYSESFNQVVFAFTISCANFNLCMMLFQRKTGQHGLFAWPSNLSPLIFCCVRQIISSRRDKLGEVLLFVWTNHGTACLCIFYFLFMIVGMFCWDTGGVCTIHVSAFVVIACIASCALVRKGLLRVRVIRRFDDWTFSSFSLFCWVLHHFPRKIIFCCCCCFFKFIIVWGTSFL